MPAEEIPGLIWVGHNESGKDAFQTQEKIKIGLLRLQAGHSESFGGESSISSPWSWTVQQQERKKSVRDRPLQCDRRKTQHWRRWGRRRSVQHPSLGCWYSLIILLYTQPTQQNPSLVMLIRCFPKWEQLLEGRVTSGRFSAAITSWLIANSFKYTCPERRWGEHLCCLHNEAVCPSGTVQRRVATRQQNDPRIIVRSCVREHSGNVLPERKGETTHIFRSPNRLLVARTLEERERESSVLLTLNFTFLGKVLLGAGFMSYSSES